MHVEDLSRTGVRFQLPAPLRPGSTYAFHADLDGFELDVLIRVTRCQAAAAPRSSGQGLVYQAGAEFQWESPAAEERFTAWLGNRGPAAGQISANLKG